jgi:hypothetical protein
MTRQIEQLSVNDSATRQAAEAETLKLSDISTVGDFLQLDTPLERNTLFQTDARRASMAALLGTSQALTNQQLQTDFIERYAASTERIEDFWKQLSSGAEFKDAVPELQFTLQLGTLTLNNPSLVTAIRQQYQPKTIRDLTALSSADWTQLIQSKNVPIPSTVAGDAAAGKTANYVGQIVKSLETAYPTDFIAQGLAKSADAIDQSVAKFLKDSPDFSLVRTHLDHYLGQRQTPAAQLASGDAKVKRRIQAYQRLARIDSNLRVMSVLMARGFDSAYKIASGSRSAFVQQHAQALGGNEKAAAVYDSAQRTTAATLNLHMAVREGLSGPHPRVFGDVSDEVAVNIQQIPNWQDLFGSTSSCTCQECRSVLGAAAYLVDLLHYLSGRHVNPADPTSNTLLDILNERRPDLVNLKLTCENTNTELPYLDLVNEILESVVTYKLPGPAIQLPAYNTPADATSDQLSVSPEHVNDAAYISLANAFYPFSLPFDRFLETARTYLEFANTSLHRVMGTFQTGVDPLVRSATSTNTILSDQTIALEYLKISPAELQILTGEPFQGTAPLTNPNDLGRYYGLDPAFIPGKWYLDYLGKVESFLRQTGVTLDELLNLIETRFLNPSQNITIQVAPQYPCDIAQAAIANLAPLDSGGNPDFTALKKIYRFIRLYKKLGWQISDLDKAFTALGAADIDATFLNKLVQIKQIEDSLNLTPVQVMALWGNIDTVGTDSLYLQVFQNKGTVNPLDPALSLVYWTVTVPPSVNVSFLDAYTAYVTYSNGQLRFSGNNGQPMTANQTRFLFSLSTDADYREAVLQLAAQGSAPLASLPQGVGVLGAAGMIIGPLPDSVYFRTDDTGHQGNTTLSVLGEMGDELRAILKSLSTDPYYQLAVDNLYEMRPARVEVATASQELSTHASTLMAALRITSGELTDLINLVPTDPHSPGSRPTTVANLSILYRYAIFLQALDLSISDLLPLIQLTGINPFQPYSSVPGTLEFVECARDVAGSKFSVAQLNYIYRNIVDSSATYQPAPPETNQLVSSIQNTLGAKPVTTSTATDPSGVLLQQYLRAILDPADVSEVMSLVNGTSGYSAPLANLPIINPTAIDSLITFANGKLTHAGIMSQSEQSQLAALSSDAAYLSALQAVFGSGQAAVAATYKAPPSPTPLPIITFPPTLSHLASIDSTRTVVSFIGIMTGSQQNQLLSLSDDPNYQAAINNLYVEGRAAQTATYSASPLALPVIGLPSALTFNQKTAMLAYAGALSNADAQLLLGLSTDSNYQTAVRSIYSLPRQFLSQKLFFLDSKMLISQLIDDGTASLQDKYGFLLNALLSVANAVLQILSSTLSLDTPMIKALLVGGQSALSPALLRSRSSAGPSALHDILMLLGTGLSATYFPSPNFGGTALPSTVVPTIDFNWTATSPPAAGFNSSMFSAKWSGQLIPKSTETYTFHIVATVTSNVLPGNSPVTLTVGGKGLTLSPTVESTSGAQTGANAPITVIYLGTIDMTGGQLTSVELDYPNAPGATLAGIQLRWSALSTPKAVIPQSQLYPSVTFTLAQPLAACSLLLRVASLINTFQITVADLEYLSSNSSGFQGVDPNNPSKTVPFDLNALPADSSTYSPALFNQWRRLLALFTLRDSLPGGDSGLLEIFQAAVAAGQPAPPAAPALVGPIAAATGWDQSELTQMLSSQIDPLTRTPLGFGLTTGDFTDERWLVRLKNCFALMTPLGVSSKHLFEWAAIGYCPAGTVTTSGTTVTWVSGTPFDASWAGTTIEISGVAYVIQSVGGGSPPATLIISTSAGVQATAVPYDIPTFAAAAKPTIARDIQAVVKSRYDDTLWLPIGKDLNNKLRESSRDALVSFIQGGNAPNHRFLGATADYLCEVLLIDPEMGACMQTSRIVQGTLAIQLFVQRILMNLEQGISPAAIDPSVWQWMKNYRVWQANRQVFLYPENYMDPTLRDDKTPFFEDLENELKQNPVTADTVEQAYLNYLEKLNQIARLDVRGFNWQSDLNKWQSDSDSQSLSMGMPAATNDVLHIVARTFGTPHTYFYRRLLNASQYGQPNSPSTWTPWERIDADIQGNHILPIVYDRRLFLIWPVFTEVSDPTNQQTTSEAAAKATSKELQIQLSWSGYFQGKWSGSQHSKDYFVPYFDLGTNNFTKLYTRAQASSLFTFHAMVGANQAFIFISTPVGGTLATPQFYYPDNTFPTAPPVEAAVLGWFITDSLIVGSPLDSVVTNALLTPPSSGLTKWSIPSNTGYDSNTIVSVTGFTTSLTINTYNEVYPPLEVLSRLPGGFQMTTRMDGTSFLGDFTLETVGFQPFAFQDNQRAYFVTPKTASNSISFQFSSCWHPHTLAFMRTLNQFGIPGLLSLTTQRLTNDGAILLGLQLGPSSSLTPSLTPGTLYAQGQLFQMTGAPNVPAMPPSSTQQLFCGPTGNLYYASDPTKAIPGDAFIGSVVSNATSVTQVTSVPLLFSPTVFNETYGPTSSVPQPYPEERVDFSYFGAYSVYNWELFFHIPLLIATQLSQNQQFEDAQKWFHYIFDPTTNSPDPGPQRFWKCLPFYECSTSDEINGPIENLLAQLDLPYISFLSPAAGPAGTVVVITGSNFGSTDGTVTFSGAQAQPSAWTNTQITVSVPPGLSTGNVNVTVTANGLTSLSATFTVGPAVQYDDPSDCGLDVGSQVSAWQSDPFSPFLIGRTRTIAFRKAVVMKYLDNLIAWGDYLFAQSDSRESINQATQLYVLAQQILGYKPVTIPQQGTTLDYSYSDIQGKLDELSNLQVALETAFPFSVGAPASGSGGNGTQTLNSTAQSFYFCIPQNQQLLDYWDTVAGRLDNIRHCRNIQGAPAQIPLFAPYIAPQLLVQAQATGVDLNSVLNDIALPSPNYRFRFMLQKALELCAEIRSLGGALLAALEKQDAEALSILRSTQELSLLNAVLRIKQSQIDEANNNLAALQASEAVTVYKQQYYQNLIAAGLNGYEQTQLKALTVAQYLQIVAQLLELAGGAGAAVPNVTIGTSGISSPVVTVAYGGSNIEGGFAAAGRAVNMLASFSSFIANMASLVGGWSRRAQEWGFQQQTATLELTQIQSQIQAAQVRLLIAQNDFQNQELQITNAQAVLDFLKTKYTNEDLYSWMVSQISATYFQCYQMVYGLAKQAEVSFRFELGLVTSNFIQFGYWDNLKKGLLAGESLYIDLKRLEIAYLDQNQREYEITKYISMALFDPIALITLKETGICSVSLPESLFDADYPGHYLRRIKSVSITIPCVTGPYTSVNCTLTLQSNQVRIDNIAGSADDYTQPSHFTTNIAATQSIATSTGQNDSGMFELNFSDDRYLPFEGAGVISNWLVELPPECNGFDFETISDVIMNLRYTARDGGVALRTVAKQASATPNTANLIRLFSFRHEFPTEWYKFLNPKSTDTVQTMTLGLSKDRFPFQFRGKQVSFSNLQILWKFKELTDTQRFNSGTPLGDFLRAGSFLNIDLSSSPFVQGQTPQPPATALAKPTMVLRPDPNFNGMPYGAASVSGGAAIWWVQVFTSDNIANVVATLLDANGHILPDVVQDVYAAVTYSVS